MLRNTSATYIAAVLAGLLMCLEMAGCAAHDTTSETAASGLEHVDFAAIDTASLKTLGAPLEGRLILAANFGELRPNHFHSGLDFKTDLKTGAKVMSVADGYVSNVTVSPWGYGLAVYVTHPELGLISVYGHLESFNDTISALVRRQQTADRCGSVDITLEPGALPVKRGEEIGRSGNSGGSFGPHLHFTLTDIDETVDINPMKCYADTITDTKAPQARSVAVLPCGGSVSTPRQKLPASETPVFEAWGQVAPAIEAYDAMDGTTNIYGIYTVTLDVDSVERFAYITDYVERGYSRAINTLIHYPALIDDDIMMMTTHQPESAPLSPMINGDGTIDVREQRDYKCRFILADYHGNKTEVPFVIRGVPASADSVPRSSGTLVEWRAGKKIVADGMSVTFPPLSLYADARIPIAKSDSAGIASPAYTIGDPHIPLASPATLDIAIITDTVQDKSRYVIAAINADGKVRGTRTTTYEAGRATAQISSLGTYTVTVDSVAPVARPLTPARWRADRTIRVHCADDLSGIEAIDATIDGKWVVPVFNTISDILTIILPSDIPAAAQTLKLTLTDGAGNTATIEQQF